MTVDKEKLRQKLSYMREQLRRLKMMSQMNYDELQADPVYEAAATRMLQITIEAMLDICAHVVAREGWGLPKTYVETVELAGRNRLIPRELIDTYKAMARFRNRAVYLYDEIDAEEIWSILQRNLDDFRPFLSAVIERYLGE